ncbi:multidrug effflux MFS transporter [Pseudoflavitalea sp. G-6-1-2]|nr:multidrug effflux MFS transporter [Pseudoflavitalea sp. G-6-1-2]
MKMKPAEFIALSACTMALTALGIDIMLPAFAALRTEFGLSHESTETSKIISFFFMGQIAQLIFGILSDRYGRLAILRLGFPLYIVCGLIAAFAPNLEVMLAARFLAGVGASAVFMTTIASVRDRFVGNQMARIMSLIFTIFLFTPVLAPFAGAAILHVFSWKAVFLTPPLFAMIVFVWSLRLEESLPKEKRIPPDWKSISRTVKSVLSNRVFLRYTAITTMLFTALSSYVSSSEHIIGDIYKRPDLFVWVFAGGGLAASLCTLLNSKLSSRYGARVVIKWLLCFYSLASAALLINTIVFGDPPFMPVFFTAIALLLGLNLAVEPNSSALALEPLGNAAGIASSLYGTSFFFIGAGLGSLISHFLRSNILPLVLSFFVLGLIATFLAFTDPRARTAAAPGKA